MTVAAKTGPGLRQERPDERGRFGEYGGMFAPETLMPALKELAVDFAEAWADPGFVNVFHHLLNTYTGRPTPLHGADHLSREIGTRVLLKREDLAHTGAHKINNALGQALLATRTGKTRLIAETGAGQHGVATATAAAYNGLECLIYMGEKDIERQALNVQRMRMLGTEVIPVTSGAGTLKDAVNEAMRDWVRTVETTHYIIGSVVGPHPFPWMVREFQKVIGEESIAQLQGDLPDVVVACVGGGSNAIGMFHPFAGREDVELIGVEAAGSRDRHGTPRRLDRGRVPGDPPRGPHVHAPGRRGPGAGGPFHLGRPRLSGSGARTCLFRRRGSGQVRVDHRRRGVGGRRPALPYRGNHSRPRIGPRRGLGGEGGRRSARPHGADQPLRAGRQGCRNDCRQDRDEVNG